uniref:Tetraspanin-6 n=1 Tax=Zea mays TaxID=4577 RepID=A0A804Q269_MAIZE
MSASASRRRRRSRRTGGRTCSTGAASDEREREQEKEEKQKDRRSYEQSGSCKPPTACQYSGGMPVGAQDEDSYRWNAPDILCYRCDSCRAGVMEQVRQDWHKIFVLDVAVLAALVCICSCGCCAFRNARHSRSQYPYGVNQTSKINPRWDYWYSKIESSVVYSLCFPIYRLLLFVE